MNALKFTAVDESGIDLSGSDEPYFKFKSIAADGAQHSWYSHVFGDIDTGDTAHFGVEGCIHLTCEGGTAPSSSYRSRGGQPAGDGLHHSAPLRPRRAEDG